MPIRNWYVGISAGDVWEFIRQLFLSIMADTVKMTVTAVIGLVLMSALLWFIQRFITSLHAKSLLLKILKMLSQPIPEKQQFVITIDDACQTLFAQKPKINSPEIQAFFDDRDVQNVLFSHHPLITTNGSIPHMHAGLSNNQVVDLHAKYRAIIEQTYETYRQKLPLPIRRSLPSTQDFGEWWTQALIATIQTKFTAFEIEIVARIKNVQENMQRMNSLEARIATYFRVVGARSYTPASPATVNAFYQGQSILTWEIVTAGAVVARSQRAEFIATYGNMLPTQFELICVTGEIGDGKTTFLWDAAYEIAKQLQCPLIQCIVPSPEAWSILAYEIERSQQPAIVLVDDVFKTKEFTDAMFAMAQVNLPVRVFATARLYDIPKFDMFACTQVRLNSPTQAEVDALVTRYNPQITNLARTTLYQASSWLILMMELSSGTSFENIVLQSLEHLRTQNVNHYNAYIYVCFVSQYNVAVPRDLLSTVRTEFWNIQIPGYLFETESSPNDSLVRAAHAQIAKVVMTYVREQFDTRTILAAYLASADFANSAHRTMLGLLGTTMIRRKEFASYTELFNLQQPYIQTWFTQCTHVEVYNQISTILHELNAEKELTILHRKMLAKKPQSTADWRSLLMYANRTKQRLTFQLLQSLKELAKNDQQDAEVWDLVVTYLNAHKSNQAAAQQLIPIVAKVISNRSSIRAQYLQLVEKFGSNVQVDAAIVKSTTWLNQSKVSPLLVIAYAQRVNQRAHLHVKQDAVAKLASFVPLNDDFAKVHPGIFHQYVRLLQSIHRENDLRQILADVRLLVQGAEWNPFVFRKFLQLIEIVGTEADKKWAIVQITNAIDHNLDDVTFHTLKPLLDIINVPSQSSKSRGDVSPELQALLSVMPQWLSHYDNSYVRSRYLKIVNQLHNHEINKQAMQSCEIWLNQTPHEQIDIVAFTGYCQLLTRMNPLHNHFMMVKNIAEYLIAEYVHDVRIRSVFAMLLVKTVGYLTGDMRVSAIRFAQQYNDWLNEHPNETWGRGNLLRLTQVLNDNDLRERIINSMIYWYQTVPKAIEDELTLIDFIRVLSIQPVFSQIDTAIHVIMPFINVNGQPTQEESFIGLVEAHGTAANKQALVAKLYELLIDNPTDENMLKYYLRILPVCDDNELIRIALRDQYNWMLIHMKPIIQEAYIRLVKQNLALVDRKQFMRTMQFWQNQGNFDEVLKTELDPLLSNNG